MVFHHLPLQWSSSSLLALVDLMASPTVKIGQVSFGQFVIGGRSAGLKGIKELGLLMDLRARARRGSQSAD